VTLTRPLFEGPAWRRARRILDEPGCRVLIALDLDGTIAPFRPRPDRARVPRRTLRSLSRGARSEAVRIAILSARPLKDMKRLVPVRNVLLLGQYGLEGPVGPPAEALRGRRRACARVTRGLKPLVAPFRGALLEDKGLTVAVHDRNVRDPGRRRELRRGLRRFALTEARREGFVPVSGPHVVDFVPRDHDKGRALRALKSKLRPESVFYFGDSLGDEPAFAVLGHPDFPVRVGRSRTRARYRVTGLAGVTRFLDAVAVCRAGPA